MKPEHTPKSSKPEKSKYSRMRNKLHLKATVHCDGGDETGVIPKTDVVGDMPSASLPSADLEDIAVDVAVDDKYVDEDNDQEGMVVTKKKNQSSLFNRSSPMKIVRVWKGMTPEQKDLISTSVFADIAQMKCSKLVPELCRFLMSCFDPVRCCLDFGGRGIIPVNAESVVRVLGVPVGSADVPYHPNVDATCLVLKMFGIHNGGHPNVSTVEKELGPEYPADDSYMRKFVIFLISSVFAPTTGIKVSPKCYPSVVNIQDIGTLKWAQFIVDIICQTASAKDKKNWFKACMPYLMVLYVDSLETDALDVPHDGTRCSVWTNKMITTVCDLDTRSDGSFGALPLKTCFRVNLSLFISEPSQVDMFIKRHLTGNHTEEDIVNCRKAVVSMYTTFEDGLVTFIRSLGGNEGTTSKHNQEEVPCSKKQKRRRVTRAPTKEVLGGHKENQIQSHADMMDVDNVVPQNADEVAGDVADHNAQEDNLNKSILGQEVPLHEDDVCLDDQFVHPQSSNVPQCIEQATPNALNQLQVIYGSASQHTTSSQNAQSKDQDYDGSGTKFVLIGSSIGKKKSVSFDIQGENPFQQPKLGEDTVASPSEIVQHSPSVRRPVTRSMSPKKPAITSQGSPQQSRRQTRLATSELRASSIKSDIIEHEPVNVCLQKGSSSYSVNNTSNKVSEHEARKSPVLVEAETQRKRRDLIDDCPSFDLGFETQVNQEPSNHLDTKEEELIVISSNESGDSLDKIYATVDIPLRTPHKDQCQVPVVTSVGPSSYTPVPEAHRKRIVKPAANQKSPFVRNDKKSVATKFANDVYSRVCSYGGQTEDAVNKQKIIDYGSFFIYLWDLADSVRPGEWLSNSTCQIALHVLSAELAEQKKHVMPLRLADKLRNANCIHDRFVKKQFKFDPECRLDHKEQISFPVLQDLTPDIKQFNGHYYLIVMNVKAERFEVLDSLRGKTDRAFTKDVRNIIGSIKGLWASNYSESNIDIQKWPTEFIDCPKQTTSYDCGFFMLKFIELWNGRNILGLINPNDMPTIRKQLTLKWLQWCDNSIAWQEMLY